MQQEQNAFAANMAPPPDNRTLSVPHLSQQHSNDSAAATPVLLSPDQVAQFIGQFFALQPNDYTALRDGIAAHQDTFKVYRTASTERNVNDSTLGGWQTAITEPSSIRNTRFLPSLKSGDLCKRIFRNDDPCKNLPSLFSEKATPYLTMSSNSTASAPLPSADLMAAVNNVMAGAPSSSATITATIATSYRRRDTAATTLQRIHRANNRKPYNPDETLSKLVLKRNLALKVREQTTVVKESCTPVAVGLPADMTTPKAIQEEKHKVPGFGLPVDVNTAFYCPDPEEEMREMNANVEDFYTEDSDTTDTTDEETKQTSAKLEQFNIPGLGLPIDATTGIYCADAEATLRALGVTTDDSDNQDEAQQSLVPAFGLPVDATTAFYCPNAESAIRKSRDLDDDYDCDDEAELPSDFGLPVDTTTAFYCPGAERAIRKSCNINEDYDCDSDEDAADVRGKETSPDRAIRKLHNLDENYDCDSEEEADNQLSRENSPISSEIQTSLGSSASDEDDTPNTTVSDSDSNEDETPAAKVISSSEADMNTMVQMTNSGHAASSADASSSPDATATATAANIDTKSARARTSRSTTPSPSPSRTFASTHNAAPSSALSPSLSRKRSRGTEDVEEEQRPTKKGRTEG
jgi:hypothetical protein